MKTIALVSLLLVVTLIGVRAARADSYSFAGLGHLPGGVPSSSAFDTSADGSVVVGGSRRLSNYEPFRWTEEEGMVGLGQLRGVATGISGDGSVVVGQSGEAFRWTQAGGMVGLGSLSGGGTSSFATSISADGSVVVGQSGEAFRWTQAGGMVGLGSLAGAPFGSQAMGVSDDGSVVVGGSYSSLGYEPFRWTEAGGMVGLGHLSAGASSSEANDTSADGSDVVGYGNSPVRRGNEAFRWTEEGGMVGLGRFPGTYSNSYATAISADGSVVVGGSSSDGFDAAFVWDEENGMRVLLDILSQQGIDMQGWVLQEASNISDDGLTIVGFGKNPLGYTEAWIATIPEPSTALLISLGLIGLGVRRRS